MLDHSDMPMLQLQAVLMLIYWNEDISAEMSGPLPYAQGTRMTAVLLRRTGLRLLSRCTQRIGGDGTDGDVL